MYIYIYTQPIYIIPMVVLNPYVSPLIARHVEIHRSLKFPMISGMKPVVPALSAGNTQT